MSKASSTRYYVYGVGVGDDEIQHIDWTDQDPKERQHAVINCLAESEIEAVKHWILTIHCKSALSIFEIESFSALEHAKESTDFWRRYFSSIGLKLIDA